VVELLRKPERGGIPEEQEMTKKRTRRTHSAEFKARIALLALRGDLTVADIAERNLVHPTQVTQWKTQLVEHAAAAFDAGAVSPDLSPVVKELHAKIGQLSVENDFLSGALGKAGMLSAKR
jgi:transposase-like protein